MKNPRDLKDRIRFVRSLTGLTAKEFCDRYGVSVSSYAKWEAGIMPISPSKAKTLVAIAEQNGITCGLSWLLHGIGQGAREKGTAQDKLKDDESNDDREGIHLIISKELEFFKKTHKNAEILVVCDKSMESRFKVGDYVGGTCIDLTEIKKYLDYPCIVTTEDGKVRLRRIGYNAKNFFLFGTNTGYTGGSLFELAPKITKLAPIFWHRMMQLEESP